MLKEKICSFLNPESGQLIKKKRMYNIIFCESIQNMLEIVSLFLKIDCLKMSNRFVMYAFHRGEDFIMIEIKYMCVHESHMSIVKYMIQVELFNNQKMIQ